MHPKMPTCGVSRLWRWREVASVKPRHRNEWSTGACPRELKMRVAGESASTPAHHPCRVHLRPDRRPEKPICCDLSSPSTAPMPNFLASRKEHTSTQPHAKRLDHT